MSGGAAWLMQVQNAGIELGKAQTAQAQLASYRTVDDSIAAPCLSTRAGSGVQQEEMIWLQSARGDWVLVEAVLDSGEHPKKVCRHPRLFKAEQTLSHVPQVCSVAGNTAGLAIPDVLARVLGFADAQGQPHARYQSGSMHTLTANGPATVPLLRPVAFRCASGRWPLLPHALPVGLLSWNSSPPELASTRAFHKCSVRCKPPLCLLPPHSPWLPPLQHIRPPVHRGHGHPPHPQR